MHDVGALPPDGFVRRGDTVTVTIGRNVGSTPMADDIWEAFRLGVYSALSSLVHPDHIFAYFGQGEWEGVTEDSACVVAVGAQYTSSIARLDSELEDLSERFGQDAIGYTVGAGRLAKP